MRFDIALFELRLFKSRSAASVAIQDGAALLNGGCWSDADCSAGQTCVAGSRAFVHETDHLNGRLYIRGENNLFCIGAGK